MEPHPRPAVERSFILSIALTSLILVAEIVGGIWTGSLALLSDAAHVFMDVFALTLRFVALRLSALPPDDRHTSVGFSAQAGVSAAPMPSAGLLGAAGRVRPNSNLSALTRA